MAKRLPLLEPSQEDEDWLRIISWRRALKPIKSSAALERLLKKADLSTEQFKKLPAYKALRDEFPVLLEV